MTEITIAEDQIPEKIKKEINTYLNSSLTIQEIESFNTFFLEPPIRCIVPIRYKQKKRSDEPGKQWKLEDFVEREKNLFLFGEVGSGKTTTLKWLRYLYANRFLNKLDYKVPILIQLRPCQKGSFFNCIKQNTKGLSEASLEYLLSHKKVLLLVDGIDELKIDSPMYINEEIKPFINKYKCQVILTSRPGFFDFFQTRKSYTILELQEFSKSETYQFIKKYVPEHEFSKCLYLTIFSNKNFEKISRTPLMLYMLIQIVKSFNINEILPDKSNKQSLLLEKFVDQSIQRYEILKQWKDSDKKSYKFLWNIFDNLFFTLKEKNQVEFNISFFLKNFNLFSDVTINEPENTLLYLCDTGLLTRISEEKYAAFHIVIQDFFAARKLSDQFNKRYDISKYLINPKWENVIVIASDMVYDPDSFFEEIIQTKNVDLANRCTNRIKEKTKQKLDAISLFQIIDYKLKNQEKFIQTRNLVSNPEKSVLGCPNALYSILGSYYYPLKFWSSLLMENNSKTRAEAAAILQTIKSETAVDPLLILLNDNDSNVRVNAAAALGAIKSERAVKPLIYTLKDEDWKVRAFAAKALGCIGSKRAIDSLLILLRDDNSTVRANAAAALGEIKSEKAVESLILSLKDEDTEVRANAAAALGEIKSEKAVASLIHSLKNKNLKVRANAVTSLGNIKSKKAIDALIFSLNNEPAQVRAKAAAALGEIKSEKAIASLILSLKDDDSEVRANAVTSLGAIKSKRAIDPLLGVLKDKNPEVRANAAAILGKLVFDNLEMETNLSSNKKFSNERTS